MLADSPRRPCRNRAPGENPGPYHPIGHVEMGVPLVFAGLYVIVLTTSFPYRHILSGRWKDRSATARTGLLALRA